MITVEEARHCRVFGLLPLPIGERDGVGGEDLSIRSIPLTRAFGATSPRRGEVNLRHACASIPPENAFASLFEMTRSGP